jgi:hypothetical protein
VELAMPVCDYPGLSAKPYEMWPPPEGTALHPLYEDQLGRASYEVCVRCGFEFGFDDDPGEAPGKSFEVYRTERESAGQPWLRKPDERDAPAG